MIITLIAPIRFKKQMFEKYVELSLNGNIVLLPVWDAPYGTPKEELIKLHRKKLDLCDVALVLDCFGYMGSDTLEEIGYCFVNNIKVEFTEEPNLRHSFEGEK